MAVPVKELSSLKEAEDLKDYKGLVVIHFWADWSEPCKQMQEAMEDLAREHSNVKFYKVAAEDVPEVSLKYNIVAVPTFILLKGGNVVDRVNGAHVPELARKTVSHSQILGSFESTQQRPKEDLETRLKKLTNNAPCMLFMKGTPNEPRCGFSRQVVSLLREAGAEFSTFNILMDDEVRQGEALIRELDITSEDNVACLKKFSNWPTYPQLYINGELIGGLDILKEMKDSGELESVLPKAQSLDVRLKKLIQQHGIMLFMKGTPEQPRCGFSRKMCDILNESKVEFGTFDILEDEEVRQGLKKYSNWPTYPQLYCKGELIGGLDIVKELQESNELTETLRL